MRSETRMALLAELPTALPDPERAERIRTRCRARLARQTPPRSAPTIRFGRVWQPLVAALGVVYLFAAIAEALSVF